MLHQVLSSDDERETLYALELLTDTDDPDIVDDAVRLTRHESPSIRAAALRLLRSASDPPRLDGFPARVADEDVSAAAEALALWMRVNPEGATEALHELVKANDPTRVGAVLDCLEELGEVLTKDTAVNIVAANLDAADPLRRRVAARALGFIPESEELVPTLLRLMEDGDVEVARAAGTSAGKFGGPQAMAALFEELRHRPLRATARRALARFGGATCSTSCTDSFSTRRRMPSLRLALPAAMAELGDARAVALLVDFLPQDDHRLHYQVIKALGKIRGDKASAAKFPVKRSSTSSRASDWPS